MICKSKQLVALSDGCRNYSHLDEENLDQNCLSFSHIKSIHIHFYQYRGYCEKMAIYHPSKQEIRLSFREVRHSSDLSDLADEVSKVGKKHKMFLCFNTSIFATVAICPLWSGDQAEEEELQQIKTCHWQGFHYHTGNSTRLNYFSFEKKLLQ